MLVKAPGNFFVSRVEAQGEVRGQHGGPATLGWIVRIRNRTCAGAILWLPLMRTGWALGQFPFVAEQVGEEVVAPLRRRRGPSHFQAAADRVIPTARAKFVLPAQTLLLDWGGFGLGTDILVGVGSAVSFAERVPAGNERNRLLVIHRHAGERLPDVAGRGNRIGVPIG